MPSDKSAGALLNISEFAQVMGVTRQTVRNWLLAGTCAIPPIEGTKPPKWWRSDVERHRAAADA